MKKYIIIFIGSCLLWACDKSVDAEQVMKNFTVVPKEVIADGASTVALSVELEPSSSTDRRSVIFTTSSGVFTASGSSKYTAKTEFINGKIIAKATLRVSTYPGTIKVSVKPEYDSPIKEYVLEDVITAKVSEPVSIKLEPSSYGIGANYINEIFLKAVLRNANGNYVSGGYKVLFEDYNANGRFRKTKDETADSSQVSIYYSAANYPIGTQLMLKCTLMKDGKPTSIKDSIKVSVNSQFK